MLLTQGVVSKAGAEEFSALAEIGEGMGLALR